MNFENDQWNIADEEFSLWLNGKEVKGSRELTDILMSTYFVFREKQRAWLQKLCNRSVEYLRTKDDSIDDHEIRFRLIHEPEKDYGRKISKDENVEIIKGILSGDQQVFNSLYEEEFPKVVRLVIKHSGNLDNAKDIFQDGLVALIERIYRKEVDLTYSVIPYLYSICKYLWINQLRKDKKNFSFDDSYSHHDYEIKVTNDETIPDVFENVNKAIETLGDPCKQLLECYYYKNLSWDEIASKLGYANAASARNQKYKCLERIRKTLNVEIE